MKMAEGPPMPPKRSDVPSESYSDSPSDSSPSLPPRHQQWGDTYQLECFHPDLSGIDAVKYALVPYLHKDGSYLVRNSVSQKNTLTVSLTYSNSIRHFKIQKKACHYYLQDRLFDSVRELIEYYKVNDVPNVEGVKNVRLLYPIVRVETGSWRGSSSSIASSIASSKPRHDSDSSFSSVFSSRQSNVGIQRVSPARTSSDSISSRGSFDEDPHKTYKGLFQSGRAGVMPPPGSGLAQSPVTGGDIVPQRGQSMREVREKLDRSVRRIRSNDLQDRPPAPLPVDEHSNGIYNGVYYSCVKRNEDNKLPQLLDLLAVDAVSTSTTLCECGLDLELSQLPQGWSVHISREMDAAFGRPFFVSPSQVTSWELPKEVYLELNRKQQKFIKFICENYEEGKEPPDEETQLRFQNYRPTESYSSQSADSALKYSGRGFSQDVQQETNRSSLEGTSSDRHSTGSNTGASHGADRMSTGSNTGASHGTDTSHTVSEPTLTDGSGAESSIL